MEFKFEYGPIEALMVLIVAEASKIAREQGGRVTRSLIQTTLCYLQPHRIRTDFEFIMTPSGPLCEDVFPTLDNLAEDNIIVDQSLQPAVYADYAAGPGALVLLPLHRRTNDLFLPAVVKVLTALIPYHRRSLELVHNLHFYYLTLRAAAPALTAWREKVVGTIRGSDEGKFWPGEVEAAYDRLVEAGLIAPDQPPATAAS